jgi:hypothetical protein
MHPEAKRRYNRAAMIPGRAGMRRAIPVHPSPAYPRPAHPRARKRLNMTRLDMTRRSMAAALMGAAFAYAARSHAQDTASVPKYPDKLAIAETNAKRMLALMDTDKNGKISKREWMDFMSAEFDRLDTDHSGELDPHELLQSDLSVQRPRTSDLGK